MAGWLLAGFYCSTISCFQIFTAGSAQYSFGRQQLIGLLLLVPLLYQSSGNHDRCPAPGAEL
jgi:hypothetical protein